MATSASLKDSRGFLERNGEDESAQRRRGLALLQRDFVHEKRAHDNLEFEGAQGAEGFRKFLRRKFGSALAGWRVLDWDCSGRLSLNEFCTACRRLGFHGNLKQLWRELDVNDNGYVSMMELDPEAGQYIATFKLELMHEYGDMLTAWQKGIDTNGNRRIDAEEIEECCKKLGLSLDPKKLFDMLRGGPKDRGVTLQQFDPDAWKRWITSDFGGLLSKVNTEFFDDFPPLGDEIPLPLEVMLHPVKDGLRKWRQTLHSRDRAWIDRAVGQNSKYRSGVCTLDGFRQLLKSRHGSLLGAWRRALDPDGRGRVSFSEFMAALGRLSVHGELRGLWQELDAQARGYITFGDIDPEADAVLSELHAKLIEKYGSLLAAWLKGVDVLGNGLVNEDQFVRACVHAGFEGNARHVFRYLLPEAGRTSISLEDFDPKSYLAYIRGDFRMLGESGTTPALSSTRRREQTFHERQKDTFASQMLRAWRIAETPEFSKSCRWPSQREEADAEEDFEELCIRKYGSIISAWRNCLDTNANGKLMFSDFCKAVRSVGYSGNVKALWHEYDRLGKGYVALRDLDRDADELVSSFLNLLTQRFGDIDTAWVAGLRKDLHASMREEEFLEACKALAYEHDARRLFRTLRPVGQHELRIWDLDPLANRRRLVPPSPQARPASRRLAPSASDSALSLRTGSAGSG